ncbi:MFS transporter [soil metagenome]
MSSESTVGVSTTPATSPSTPRLGLTQVVICSAVIIAMSLGVRHGFGLWLQPITLERGWSRETFAFAIAVQNLAWGAAGPLAGMVADRFGSFRVLVVGTLLYMAGLILMGVSNSVLGFTGSAGLLIGMAQAGTTYSIIFGIIGRNVAPEKRAWAMGVTAAAGSFGQFLMVPVESWLIGGFGWQNALFVLGCASIIMIPLAFGLREEKRPYVPGTQSMTQALKEAFAYKSFLLLMCGYFVCGFQVVFIGVHMPSYLKDKGMSPEVATYALALIGLFNVIGTYLAGTLASRMPNRFILSGIYGLRSVVIVVFLLTPVSPLSVYIFAAFIGLLWLSTVPPTNSVIAGIFGVRYLSMLSGFVFFSHQIGSFMGVWLGGRLYDMTGSYDVVWWIAVALGVAAALVNIPIREGAIHRPQPAVAPA